MVFFQKASFLFDVSSNNAALLRNSFKAFSRTSSFSWVSKGNLDGQHCRNQILRTILAAKKDKHREQKMPAMFSSSIQ